MKSRLFLLITVLSIILPPQATAQQIVQSMGVDARVDVYAAGTQLSTDAIFADGFESGNSNAWSVTTP